MSTGALVAIAAALLVAMVVVDVVQLVWVARRANPVPTPHRDGWTVGTMADVTPGDVVRGFHLGPRPGIVASVATDDGTTEVHLTDGRHRRLAATTPVRRWRPPS